jgi:hypothetical protein
MSEASFIIEKDGIKAQVTVEENGQVKTEVLETEGGLNSNNAMARVQKVISRNRSMAGFQQFIENPDRSGGGAPYIRQGSVSLQDGVGKVREAVESAFRVSGYRILESLESEDTDA